MTLAIAAALAFLVLWVQALRLCRKLRRLEQTASTDELTGLVNRHEIFAALALPSGPLPNAAGAWALIIDLDGFKAINDTLGHTAGDQLLIGVAKRIRNAVRDGDVVGRLGGDEFVVVLRCAENDDDPTQVAERIISAISAPFRLGPRTVRATASIGIAELGAGAQNKDGCPLVQADLALYEAKDLGGDCVVMFEEGLGSRIEERKSIEERLREAARVDQFSLHFQPECDLARGEIIGAEALLRWSPPGGAIIEAADFIEGLDDSGLLVDLAPRIVEQAANFVESSDTLGDAFTLRINMTAEQLLAPRMDSVLEQAVKRCAPATLCVELSAAYVDEPTSELVSFLRRLRHWGVEIAIDDFGTGSACLLLLNSMQVDEVKIDRRFVQELAICDPEASIAVALIRLVQARGIRVSAQGIETVRQKEALRAAGCERGQGFLFGPALDPTEFAIPQRQSDDVVDLSPGSACLPVLLDREVSR